MLLPLSKSALLAWVAALVLLVVVCLALFGRRSDSKTQAHGPDTNPASLAATKPASRPAMAPEPKYVSTFMDVVHAEFPALPVTQPLAMPLNLSEAARLVVRDPVYFDASGSLIWITRPDAPPSDKFLKRPPDDPERVVVTRERVLYVHWLADSGGIFWPFLVVPAAADASPGSYEMLSHLGRQSIGSRRDYRWDRAMSWNEKLVVPTATGVSVFRFELDADGRPVLGPNGPIPIEEYQDLVNPTPASGPAVPVPATEFADPQILLDWQGLLAFIPWDPGKQGGHGAARFVNEKWMALGPAMGWPECVLHLVPLNGGSVMQLVPARPSDEEADTAVKPSTAAADPHTWPVKLSVFDLDHANIDPKAIRVLVAKLGDDDQAVRDAAFNDLTRYGPGIWPILKDLFDDAAPEAQARMKQLLRNQAAPLLGGMLLLGDDIRLVCRNSDGSAVFYSEKGVQSAGPDGDPQVTAPAWLAVRPGHPVELLPPILITDVKPDAARITSVFDEWIVDSDVRGPRRFIGNGFINLLKKDEIGFSEVVGEDHRGRWLFRRPTAQDPTRSSVETTISSTSPSASQPATMPARLETHPGADGIVETLIIDPTLPNLVPRLPVWNYTTADEVGWDHDDWPTLRQLGKVHRLTENGWDEASEVPLLSQPEQAPKIPGPPATQPAAVLPIFVTSYTPAPATFPATATPASRRTTGAATEQSHPLTTMPASEAAATEPAEAPLWVDRDGTRYFNGIDELRIVSSSGTSTSWTLPAAATGKEPVHLVKTKDGRLYLFNQPGRVLRFKPTPDGPEPFILEATFTRNIPNVDQPTRVWLDPAGRIIMAHDKILTILFPAGYIAPGIRALMSNVDDEDADSPKP